MASLRRFWRSGTRVSVVGGVLAALAVAAAAWLGCRWSGHHVAGPGREALGASAPHGPTMFVAQFKATGKADAALAHGFTRDVVVGLTRFQDLFVYGPDTSFRLDDQGGTFQVLMKPGVDYVLSGGVDQTADRFRVSALLVDARIGRNVWSESFDTRPTADDLFRVQDEIANRLIRALAGANGFLFSRRAQEVMSKPRQLGSYECVARYRLFSRHFDPQQLDPTRECLEGTVRADPDYADGNSALALITVDALRIGASPPPNSPEQLDRALLLAKRAAALAPQEPFGHQALQHVHWMRGELDSSVAAARQAVALNPHNSEALAELGMRLAMRNDWTGGLPLLEEAYTRDPLQPGIGRQMLSLRRYTEGRYEDALAEAQRIDLPQFVYQHVLLAMAHARLGHRQEADAEVRRILELNPRISDEMTRDLERRHLHPDLIRVIADGLKGAGLEVVGPSGAKPVPKPVH